MANAGTGVWGRGAFGALLLGLGGAFAACDGGDDASKPQGTAAAAVDAGSNDADVAGDAGVGPQVDAAPSADAGPSADGGGEAAAVDGGDAGAEAGPVGPSGTWSPIFDDEFDGASLDSSKWNSGWFTDGITTKSPPVQASELQYYDPAGVVFPGDGAVHLRLTKDAGLKKAYRSGMIQTSNRFSFDPRTKAKVVEARIKVPGPNDHAKGYWPAFWILPNDNSSGHSGGWPPEIDIFEFFSNSTNPASHFHTSGKDINFSPKGADVTSDKSLAFHTYTFEMSPDVMNFYIDGKVQWTYADTSVIANLFARSPNYLLFNLAFGGAGGAPNDATILPAEMVIDYVRAWSR